ncbi:Mur ligase middle domain protein [Actinomyces johnsonii F0542]|uniref:Lipid II isoglutaminyl synthase (glutamine-hydrolyzing) subunit MurT n=1 Tax=Actinomyces johnsonii F0542 TaxID=1321818 RepID=U1PZ30_9ACTO|nr:Mur ligase family protein [Actinomyces johnsonii]ERH21050.1 Mur ligase middle domain protein [Actinomyces johnsonii F0542]
MRSRLTVTLGHAARLAARLRGGGSGGTAFPGLVMERTDPGFLARTLNRLPRGVIVVSGTNGKTTTTKMVVQLLREQGLKVFTNRTGSNFVRGVLASLLTEVDAAGRLDADIAVLELDEAHAVHFVARVRPRACLLLNVMRDQLDRFGEIDYTASLLHSIAKATSDVVVLNGDDPRLAAPAFLEGVSARVVSFGTGEDLRSLFLSDDDLRTGQTSPRAHQDESQIPGPRVTLEAIDGQRATVRVDGASHEVDFAIPGVHNLLNACAALGVVLEVLGEDADLSGLLTTLGTVQAAFGRGEVLTLDGRPVQLSLVKNPAGFRMGLLSAAAQAQSGEVVVVAINDEYADGRDMSWLWDVDFAALRPGGVAVVTGVRAWDMALRLRYDDVEVTDVEPDLRKAVALMRRVAADTDRPMRIFTTYTAMLALRSILGEMTDVEEVMS